jgi:hypothetical protein
MVAVLKSDGREAGYHKKEKPVFKRAAGTQPVELQANFVLNEKQYEHFTQCMNNAEEPTALMLDAHAKLQAFIKASK